MKNITYRAVLVAFGVIAGIGGIAFALASPTQNIRSTVVLPSPCTCSGTISIGHNATLANCQCGAILCAVAVGGQKQDANPAIACFK
jgi:hypothetical protein